MSVGGEDINYKMTKRTMGPFNAVKFQFQIKFQQRCKMPSTLQIEVNFNFKRM